jgi:hypothetical protein
VVETEADIHGGSLNASHNLCGIWLDDSEVLDVGIVPLLRCGSAS